MVLMCMITTKLESSSDKKAATHARLLLGRPGRGVLLLLPDTILALLQGDSLLVRKLLVVSRGVSGIAHLRAGSERTRPGPL